MQRLGLLIICLMLCLAACSRQGEAVPTTAVRLSIPSSTATVTASLTPPATLTSSPSPTNRPPLTHTPKKTSTPLSSPSPEMNVLKESLIDPNDLGADIFLETVFWSDDGKTIYYALSSPINGSYERSIQWLAYDIQTGESITLTGTPKIDRNIVLPLHIHGFYPELRGITSPSGRYTFNEIHNESNQITEIWLRDRVTQKDTKLVETFPGYIYTAEWFSDETQVILDIAYQEYGGISYLINTQTGITEPLCQSDDFQCWIVEERLTLSPDDSMLAGLAYVDGQFQIRIDSLDDGTSTYIRESASQLTWSFDGRLLYYWLGIPWAGTPITQLRVYDTTSGSSSTEFDLIILNEQGVCSSSYGCYFDTSPDGKKMVFWTYYQYENFWIVTFPVTPSAISNTPTPTYISPFSALPPGQYLLYWTAPSTQIRRLNVISHDGAFQKILQTGNLSGYFSPDLTRKVYDSGSKLVIVDLASNTFTNILDTDNCNLPNWSPDGKKLVAECNGDIRVISLESDDRILLTNWSPPSGEDYWDYPVWSPDGKWIAYLNRHIAFTVNPRNGIYITDTTCLSDPATCQSKTSGLYIGPLKPPIAWAPDSRSIVSTLETSMRIMDIQNGTFREILDSEDVWSIDYLEWSPDGRWIAYNCGITNPDLCLVSTPKRGEVIRSSLSEYVYINNWILIPHPFAPGDLYTITDAGANLNLRAEPSLDGEILRKLQPGDTVTILDGPVEADGYTWWQMQAEDGVTGWAVNIPEWYEAVEE